MTARVMPAATGLRSAAGRAASALVRALAAGEGAGRPAVALHLSRLEGTDMRNGRFGRAVGHGPNRTPLVGEWETPDAARRVLLLRAWPRGGGRCKGAPHTPLIGEESAHFEVPRRDSTKSDGKV